MDEITIKDAKIKSVYDIWMRKPHGLSFNDTNLVIINATKDGKAFKKVFYTCIKPDGTFETKTIDRRSKARRSELGEFLIRNNFAKRENVESYNLKQGIKEWAGKKVRV